MGILTPEEVTNILFSDREGSDHKKNTGLSQGRVQTFRKECASPVPHQPPPQQRRRGVAPPSILVAMSKFEGALSKGHGDDDRNATAMGKMKVAIVRIGAEVAEVQDSLHSSMAPAEAPSAFWARLLEASSADPTVQSTATAFKVVPLVADVDGLKDAVAVKMRLVLAAPLLEVWVHDAASNRWVPVDEDSALVTNSKATAYHVVVPASHQHYI